VRKIREMVRSDVLGQLRMVHNWFYTAWMYRPRMPEELDTGLGGGVTFRQGASARAGTARPSRAGAGRRNSRTSRPWG
jgi:hypothetical protein